MCVCVKLVMCDGGTSSTVVRYEVISGKLTHTMIHAELRRQGVGGVSQHDITCVIRNGMMVERGLKHIL